MIYAIDELAKTTTERAKVVTKEREQQSQSQGTILRPSQRLLDNRHKLLPNLQGNYLTSSEVSTLGIFKKQVDLTVHLYKLKIIIFLPVGERMKLQQMSMANILILLEQWLLKGYLLILTQLHNLEPTMSHFL